MKKKAVSTIEYVLILALTTVIVAGIVSMFNPEAFKNLFKYTFQYKGENNSEIQIGPMTQ